MLRLQAVLMQNLLLEVLECRWVGELPAWRPLCSAMLTVTVHGAAAIISVITESLDLAGIEQSRSLLELLPGVGAFFPPHQDA